MLAIYCMVSMRSNLGVAMVCMVNTTAVESNSSTKRKELEQCNLPVDNLEQTEADLGYHVSTLFLLITRMFREPSCGLKCNNLTCFPRFIMEVC
jgi:hypothetical protein